MIVERIWTGNSLRNYNYLIACPDTGQALAIDPLDAEKCLNTAKVKGWQITQVLNTHEHHDHVGGNAAVVAATGAQVIAHHKAAGKIGGVDRGVGAGDVIRVGRHIELQCLDTPGHTMCHICLFAHTDEPALFSGDTLFNAGAGNVHNGGSVDALFDTFEEQLARLPESTRLFPGHDYLENNLRFTLDREPDNKAAQAKLAVPHDPQQAAPTTLAQERQHNSFMRLDSPSLIAILRKSFPDLPDQPDRRTVFAKLRELRNRW
jgi:hydroxyacylglutathione hydrolase